MKKYIFILTFIIPVFVFTSCTESDDEFFASTTLTANDLIEVSLTGDEVTISSNIPRILPQATNPFDIFLTSTSRKMFFNYTIQKKNSNNVWEYITPSNIVLLNGENQTGSYISGIAILDALDTTYEYESKITLTTGQYRISFDPEIVTLNAQNAVMVTVKTSVTGIPNNMLEFTIN